MPAFGGRLSDEDIQNVAAFVIDQAEGGKWDDGPNGGARGVARESGDARVPLREEAPPSPRRLTRLCVGDDGRCLELWLS